ncbi:hypothetical protein TA3x_005589 [Tundrisphaera sp. TA3]|uniref:hypothetical protein n=1 Tax=Tundrisphaera sp. TA3 TaxID=3435775 RepID=UPI003EBFA161
MSDEKAADDGILGRARRLADQVGEYARFDEARQKLDGVKQNAAKAGGIAMAGAKRLVEGTKQAADQAKVGVDEFSKSERVQSIRAKAKEDWDEIRGGLFRGSRLSDSLFVVGLVIFVFFPLGLYLLWKHPSLGRSKRWWWAGGTWGLIVALVFLDSGKHRKNHATSPPEQARLEADTPAPSASRAGRSAVFKIWSEPLTVLAVDQPGGRDWIREIDFSPDGRYLITQGRLWAMDGWHLLNPERRSRIHDGLFSPVGSAFSSAWSDELLVWKINDGQAEVVEKYRLITGFNSDDRNALGFPYVDCDALWTPYGVAVAAPVPEPEPTGSERLMATESGREAQKSAAIARMAKIRDSAFPFLETGSKRRSFELGKPTGQLGSYTFAFSSRGRMMARLLESRSTLAVNGVPGYEELPHRVKVIEVWSWPGGDKPLFRTKVEGDSGMAYDNQIAFLPDGTTFLITSSQKDPDRTWTSIRHVAFLDTTTWKETNRFESKDINFHVAAISPDGSKIATTSGSAQDFTVTLWKPTSSEPLRVIKSLYADQVLFTPDGETLVTAVEGGGSLKRDKTHHINFFDVASGACIGRIKDRGICSIAISPDGQYLVSGHSDSVAKVWDLRKGRTVPYEDEYEEYNLVLAGESERDELLSRPAPPITRRAFESLVIGMKYDQVREALGGSEHSSKSLTNLTDPKFRTYQIIHVLGFKGNGGPGSGAVLIFGSDGITNLRGCRLIDKQETGLR